MQNQETLPIKPGVPTGNQTVMKVFNPLTRQPDIVPLQDAYDGLISGKYEVSAEDTYKIVKDTGDPGGEAYTISGRELSQALQQGYMLDSPHSAAIRKYRDENQGVLGGAKAFALNAADEALLGLPEVASRLGAGRWLPDPSKVGLPTLEEYDALSAIYPGSSMAGSVTGFLGSLAFGPVGLAARGSTVAGRVTEEAAAKGLGKIIARSTEGAVGRVTAGTAARDIVAKMAGGAVEGATFMVPQAATEAYFGDYNAAAESLKSGGMVGGLIGGSFGVIKNIGKMSAEKMAGRPIVNGKEALEEVGTAVANVFTGVDKDAVRMFRKDADKVINAKSLEEVTDTFLQKVKEVRSGTSQASAASREILESAGVKVPSGVIGEAFLPTLGKLDEIAKTNPIAKKAYTSLTNYGSQLERVAAEQGGELTGIQVKNALEYLDGLVDYKNPRSFGLDKLVSAEIKGIRKGLDLAIKEKSPAYKSIMADLSAATKTAKAVSDRFRQDKGAENLLKRIMNGKDRFVEKDLEKFDQLFGTTFVDDLKNSWARKQFEKETTQGTRKTYGYSQIGGLGGLLTSFDPISAVVGSAAGAVAGMVADKYGTKAVYQSLKALNLIENAVSGTTKKLGGISGFVQELAKPSKMRSALRRPLFDIMRGDTSEKRLDDYAEVKRIRDLSSQMIASPAMMQEKIRQLTGPLANNGAPNVSDALQISLTQSLNYILQSIPKEARMQSPFAPKIDLKPSDADMHSFKNKMEVLQDPWAVLDHIKDGTLSLSHVDSLRANYPALYNYIQVHIQHAAANSEVALPYQKRVMLSILFGEPLDESLKGQKLLDLQNSFIAPEDGSKEKAADIEMAAGMATETDKFQKKNKV